MSDEGGFVGGFEVLPFGLLVFVAGMLLVTNAWAVIDGTAAASAAAREAARVYVEAPSEDGAATAAIEAAMATIEGHGRDRTRADVRWETGPTWDRCARNTIVVEYRVPTLTVPFLGAFGGGVITTSGRHTEVVDPYRSGLAVDGFDPETCRA
jgi:hypothetical protein